MSAKWQCSRYVVSPHTEYVYVGVKKPMRSHERYFADNLEMRVTYQQPFKSTLWPTNICPHLPKTSMVMSSNIALSGHNFHESWKCDAIRVASLNGGVGAKLNYVSQCWLMVVVGEKVGGKLPMAVPQQLNAHWKRKACMLFLTTTIDGDPPSIARIMWWRHIYKWWVHWTIPPSDGSSHPLLSSPGRGPHAAWAHSLSAATISLIIPVAGILFTISTCSLSIPVTLWTLSPTL